MITSDRASGGKPARVAAEPASIIGDGVPASVWVSWRTLIDLAATLDTGGRRQRGEAEPAQRV
ncbi:MAG: hypothetical protein GEV04_12090 [Actinophytocola sp.]|nr:hypothetical protein [Actinophytocola sp.]